MPRKPWILALCLVALTALVGGSVCAQQATPPPQQSADDRSDEVYDYTSEEGNFRVTWPSGCGTLQIVANDPEYFVDEEEGGAVLIHLTICDRTGQQGEGCSVRAIFESRNAEGGGAGREEVLERVGQVLAGYGVKVVRQAPVRRELADGQVIEGVDVFGTRPDGEGQFRVRGLLSYHDIYLLTAWSMKGDLWENPEFQEFFDGFVPDTE